MQLRPGTYTVTEIQRDVDVDGKDSVLRASGFVSATVNDRLDSITLSTGQTGGGVFGEQPSLSGYVYQDDNEDGLHQPDVGSACNSPEVGIPGVGLQLTGVDVYNNNVSLNLNTVNLAATVFDRCPVGFYYFGGLVTGTYYLHEIQPAGCCSVIV